MAMRPIHFGWEPPTCSHVQPFNLSYARYPMYMADDSSFFPRSPCSPSAQLWDQSPKTWRQSWLVGPFKESAVVALSPSR